MSNVGLEHSILNSLDFVITFWSALLFSILHIDYWIYLDFTPYLSLHYFLKINIKILVVEPS